MGIIWAIFLIVAGLIAAYVVEATLLMISFGVMHLDWWQAMPSMGFGVALSITLCLDTFLTMIIVAAVRIAAESK